VECSEKESCKAQGSGYSSFAFSFLDYCTSICETYYTFVEVAKTPALPVACKFFKLGKCSAGKGCRFSHDPNAPVGMNVVLFILLFYLFYCFIILFSFVFMSFCCCISCTPQHKFSPNILLLQNTRLTLTHILQHFLSSSLPFFNLSDFYNNFISTSTTQILILLHFMNLCKVYNFILCKSESIELYSFILLHTPSHVSHFSHPHSPSHMLQALYLHSHTAHLPFSHSLHSPRKRHTLFPSHSHSSMQVPCCWVLQEWLQVSLFARIKVFSLSPSLPLSLSPLYMITKIYVENLHRRQHH
jgi:hypothetical protein